MTNGLNITIAGAGSGYTPGIILSILNHKDLDVKEIRLYDNDPIRNNDMKIIMDFIINKNGYDIEVIQTENPQEAFIDADFVFSQIRVGKMEMREVDEKIPLKYGLVGQETCGLGGFSYAMRSMKGFSELIDYIQEYAPNAWILNYTNPETIISEVVRRKYPDAKIINACDMTIGIEEMVEKSFGYNRKNFIPTYYGLNHFGWYESIWDKSLGRDIMPEVIEKVIDQGFDVSNEEKSWANTWEEYRRLVETFPDRLPNNYLYYYLFSEQAVEKMDKSHTRANEIMEGRLKKLKDTVKEIKTNPNLDSIPYESTGHGQYIVDIAASIIHNKNERFMIIKPNMGAIPNLRDDAVVEVPCYVNSKGAEPISLRHPIPDFHKGLMEAQVAAEKLLVDAFFEQSYYKALQAFTLNLTVPNAELAKKILDEFIEVNGNYWPTLN